MDWHPLRKFHDRSVPKLHNLRRAAAAGVRVPPTWWTPAAQARQTKSAQPPVDIRDGPLIIRSGSPSEDQHSTSNAGQFLSLPVRDRSEFHAALQRVVDSLACDDQGSPQGVVFVQPLVDALEGGVAFFDGFYYERALAAGGNQELTSGQTRGQVVRGHLMRGEPWSRWLDDVYAVFAGDTGDTRLDIEFARDAKGFVLLQVRPALFPVRRNETLTLANTLETLGELPSPWAASALTEAGRDLTFMAISQPAVWRWGESSTLVIGGRLWLNLSLAFRFADSLGAPRRSITAGMGGQLGNAADGSFLIGRLLRSLPRIVWAHLAAFKIVWSAERDLRALDAAIATAKDLPDLYRVSVAAYERLITTASFIFGLCTEASLFRRLLQLPSAARLVTQDMMEEYSRLAGIGDPAERAAGLDAWLTRYGHRGPHESDLGQPRFAELRDVLRRDLESAAQCHPPCPRPLPTGKQLLNRLLRPFSWIDGRREWFRDVFMRTCQELRRRILECGNRLCAAGELGVPEDVFWLRGSDLIGDQPLRAAVAAARASHAAVRDVELPITATREVVEALLARAEGTEVDGAAERTFPGISLGAAAVEGRVLKAKDLMSLLAEIASAPHALGSDTILVVPALEPSWAVLFPRVAGVVAEVGGELSHASILLREAGKPALVNCTGIFRQVQSGDRLRLDGKRGLAILLVK